MPTISFTISTANLERIKAAMKGNCPIPETDGKADFTDTQWAKEVIRQIIINEVWQWEDREARKVIDVKEDNNLLT